MTLSAGTRLGPYEIIEPIGAGGMGEVYRATDTRLNRKVAIKVLRGELYLNPESLQRFEREARTISSISHPNICSLHDIGQQDGIHYLVMEYIEGESLVARLKKGPLSLDQVFRYGIEISEALSAAHKGGIIHRDLKPGNIMLTKSGAKLLDFGLAKLREEDPASSVSDLATKSNLSIPGHVMGTLAYMSPEHIDGKVADARSDIFALGLVLYEMSTGKRAFQSDGPGGLMTAIMTLDPPPPSTLNPKVPAPFDRLVKNCLLKDPDARYQNAHDVALDLRSLSERDDLLRTTSTNRFGRLSWILTVVSLVLILASAFLFWSRRAVETVIASQTVRFSIAPPQDQVFDGSIAVSPDGKRVAFVATQTSGNTVLWIRPIDSIDAQFLTGTEGARDPFWSPDSRFIGFFQQGKLKKVDLSGQLPQVICDAIEPRGGTWNRENTILFSGNQGSGLFSVSANGSVVTPVTALNTARHEASHRGPQFLPDGKHFLFLIVNDEFQDSGLYVGSLDSKEQKFLVRSDSSAVYAPPGYIIFKRGDALMGQPFDANRLELRGESFTVTEEVWRNDFVYGDTAFSISANDVLVYRTGGIQNTQFLRFDRAGKLIEIVGPPGCYAEPSLSPDETKISLSRVDPRTASSDIYLLELLRGTITRLTPDPTIEVTSIWSPDGSKILYSSYPESGFFQKSISGSQAQLLLKPESFAVLEDWSPDGQYIIYTTLDFQTSKMDIWMLPTFGDHKPRPYLKTEFNDNGARVSPNGNWLAYYSDESGKWEVYVQSFPEPGNKVQISTNGGMQPTWRGDGKELYYIAPDNKLMSVPVRQSSRAFEVDLPTMLFQTQIAPAVEARNNYVVSKDGESFFINTRVHEVASAPIEVVLNWSAGLRK